MLAIKCITFEEELKKNPELKISDIQILKEWCSKQSHLPKIQDMELAIFLHSNYYRIEPTKNTIENYYTYRTHAPELFSNRNLQKEKRLRDAFKVTAHIHVEGKTKEGYTILASRLLNTEPSHFYLNETMNAGFMLYEKLLWTHGSTPGYILIVDGTGPTIGHIGRLNLASLKKFIYYVQDAMPVRLKGIHIINMSPIMEAIINMVKPLFNMEVLSLLHLHSNMQSASEYFPIEALPNEFGGKAGATQELVDAQLKKIENFREWYLADEKNNRVNESLRVGKSKISNDLFGIDGNFKKLEID